MYPMVPGITSFQNLGKTSIDWIRYMQAVGSQCPALSSVFQRRAKNPSDSQRLYENRNLVSFLFAFNHARL